MKFENLVYGKLIRRYKRFLADVELESGEVVVAHTTNSGSLKSCIVPGAPVTLSPANNPKRKTKYTWEMIKIRDTWVGINTNVANDLAEELLKNNIINGLPEFTLVKREVKFSDSRFDFYCETEDDKYFIEVKNVTYREGDYALFPDARTTRGLKHLNTLVEAIDNGYKAAMIYIIQRDDTKIFAPAKEIDPDYAKALKRVHKAGVEIFPVQMKVSPEEIRFKRLLDFEL